MKKPLDKDVANFLGASKMLVSCRFYNIFFWLTFLAAFLAAFLGAFWGAFSTQFWRRDLVNLFATVSSIAAAALRNNARKSWIKYLSSERCAPNGKDIFR